AGDRSAANWPPHARRVHSPEPFKDWTEAKAGGVDLTRWWGDILAGVGRPPLFSWDELSRRRWGGADEAPGLDNPGRPFDPERFPRATAAGADPAADAEREAIQAENDPG